jgi:cation transport regulator
MGNVTGDARNVSNGAVTSRKITAFERGPPMPYRSNEDLPSAVTRHLPPHAQDIYRAAFNHAFAAHDGDPRQEEASHRIAWAAVKRVYVKSGERWVARGDLPA